MEEVHDALLWMGFVTDDEAREWSEWLLELATQDRVIHKDGRWFAADGPTEAKQVLLDDGGDGPVAVDDPRIAMGGGEASLLAEFEREGAILRTRLDGQNVWCERRLLAQDSAIHP